MSGLTILDLVSMSKVMSFQTKLCSSGFQVLVLKVGHVLDFGFQRPVVSLACGNIMTEWSGLKTTVDMKHSNSLLIIDAAISSEHLDYLCTGIGCLRM